MLTVLADECVNRDTIFALQSVADMTIVRVQEAGLTSEPDETVFEFAQKHQYVLLTFGKDFGDIRKFDPKNSFGIIIVYVENFGRNALISETKQFFESTVTESLRGKGYIIEPGRVRSFP